MCCSQSPGAFQLLTEPTSRLGWTRTAVAEAAGFGPRFNGATKIAYKNTETSTPPKAIHRHFLGGAPSARTSRRIPAARNAFTPTSRNVIPYTPVHGANSV